MNPTKNMFDLPLNIEPNVGQLDSKFTFLAHCKSHTLYSKPDRLVVLSSADGKDPCPSTSCLSFNFLGGNIKAKARFIDKLKGKVNYFLGDTPESWLKNIPTYSRVKYYDVYPSIDLVFYGLQNQVEYDFIVRPGGNPERIITKIQGASSLQKKPKGDLAIQKNNETFLLQKPVAYQVRQGKRKLIKCGYTIRKDNKISFRLGKYDKTKNLIIDPILVFSTYLGGISSDSGTGVAVDKLGDIYITGFTSSIDFPTKNPFQPDLEGFTNAFVTKIDGNGTEIIYSTYLGGNNTTLGTAIDVDSFRNAYITGTTSSTNFPTVNPIQSNFSGASDAFVAKLSADGSELIYSTYLGGRGLDIGSDIAVDESGNAYIGGLTGSENFPVFNPLQRELAGSLDCFVTKITPAGSAFVYSTYLGGTGADTANGIAVDQGGNAYITGSTTSEDFPTVRPLQQSLEGTRNAFVSKINSTGTNLIYSTYLGGSGFNGDQGNDLAVDHIGNAYIVGQTDSPDFPTVNPLQGDLRGEQDAFISKIDSTGTQLIYSTYLGGDGIDFGNAITVDDFGNAYLTGVTQSDNFPTVDPLQSHLNGASDAFITQIDNMGLSLLFSTYLGGNGEEEASGIALDFDCNLIITGTTTSENFPIEDPLQANFGGFSDAFVVKLFLESACEE